MMPSENDYIKVVGSLTRDLEKADLYPVLVGGMALVLLGSQRVTKDFDFLISFQKGLAEKVIKIFYRHGFELISKFNEKQEVIRTIGNANVAASRLKLDSPTSAYFYHYQSDLKIDLLFDFPILAKEVAGRAHLIKVKKHLFRVASREDLIRLKEIAFADRCLPSDAQDLEFLRNKPK